MNYRILLSYSRVDEEYARFFSRVEELLGYYNALEFKDDWIEDSDYPRYYTIDLKLTNSLYETLSKEFEIIKINDLD